MWLNSLTTFKLEIILRISWHFMYLLYNWWKSIWISYVQLILKTYSLLHVGAWRRNTISTLAWIIHRILISHLWFKVWVSQPWALESIILSKGVGWSSRLWLISNGVLSRLIFEVSKHQTLTTLSIFVMGYGHCFWTTCELVRRFPLLVQNVLVLSLIYHFH